MQDAMGRTEKDWGYLPSTVKTYPVVDGVPECETCGRQHVTLLGNVSCSSHNASGGACRHSPMRGGTQCNKHGVTQQGKRANKVRLAEEEAAQFLSDVEIKPIGHPLDELAVLAAEMLASKDHYANLLSQVENLRYTDSKGAEQLRSEVGMYERGLDRAERVLSTLVKLEFEEKRLALEERRAHMVTVFINGVLNQLGRQLEEPEVRQAIERWLPILDGATLPEVLDADIVDGEIVE